MSGDKPIPGPDFSRALGKWLCDFQAQTANSSVMRSGALLFGIIEMRQWIGLIALVATSATAQNILPDPKPVPSVQVLPIPEFQAAFERDGSLLGRYYFNPAFNRPFVYPVIGPAGRSLTRMGHPHDPESHSHHNSVWVAHNDVDGVNPAGHRRTVAKLARVC
jgi:hypothetical protein